MGYVPLSNQGKIPLEFMNVQGFEIVGIFGANNPLPPAETNPDGAAYICDTDDYIDPNVSNITCQSGDLALDIGDVYNIIPSTGNVSADQVIETEFRHFVSPDDVANLQDQLDTLENSHDTKLDKIGDTITGTLVLHSPERDINVISGISGALKYNDARNFRWGSNKNFSDVVMDMTDNKILNLAKPTNDPDAANKKYVNDEDTLLSVRIDADIASLEADVTQIENNYLPLSGGTSHKMTADIYMAQHRIKGIPDAPENNQDAVNKLYVDTAVADGITTPDMDKYLDLTKISSQEMAGTLVLNSTERDIDVISGISGTLKYVGDPKFRWGNTKNFSEQELSMINHRISDLGYPMFALDAVHKEYCDANARVGFGRPYINLSNVINTTDFAPGDMFLVDSSGAKTNIYADAAKLKIAWDDLDGIEWATSQTGTQKMPQTTIMLLDHNNKQKGWWTYTGVDTISSVSAGMFGGGSGSISIPIENWQKNTGASGLNNTGMYRIHCSWWG
jgi:hypothetical protein